MSEATAYIVRVYDQEGYCVENFNREGYLWVQPSESLETRISDCYGKYIAARMQFNPLCKVDVVKAPA